jgi:flagellar capping protein FliD
MGRIQSTTGIISGIPITDTVDQLIKVQSRPRDLLVSRSQGLQKQQTAITDLTASVIAVQISIKKLLKPETFQQKSVNSSNKALLTAVTNGTPANGTYRFTPVRQATSQQVLSTGFAARDEALGLGSFDLQFGGNVDQSVALSELNGGAGVQRGKIRITDRSGESAVVDLRFAQSVDDVLKAINQTDSIQVKAVAEGDRIRLIDRTGESVGNLKVVEVSGGSTAADLGLGGIDVASDEVLGKDVYKLYNSLDLTRLNDGNGLSIRGEANDLKVTLRDGTSIDLNFNRLGQTADFAKATTTGAADAQITFTGKTTGADLDNVRIQFIDDAGVTAGSETVVYDDSNPANKTLTFHIDAGATTADNVIAALTNDPTASAVFGAARATGSNGSGLVTTNDTAVTTGGAQIAGKKERTLGDLLQTINSVDPSRLKAEISTDGDRIVLKDLTTDLGGTFAVTNTTGGTLAEDLGLTGTAVGDTLTSDRVLGGLKTSLLRSFNGGAGLGTLGSVDITDRSGATASVDLSGAQTLDDVIKAINDTNIGVEARVNSARNGIELVDNTGEIDSNFKIVSTDSTNTAEALGIAADVANTRVNGGTLKKQTVSEQTLLSALNGGKGVARTSFFISDSKSSTTVIRLDNEAIQTVGDLVDAINALTIGVEAKLNDAGDGIQILDTAGGSGSPSIRDVGSGTAAKDLHLTGGAQEVTIDGEPRQVITGSQKFHIDVDEDDTLENVVSKINQLGGAFTASIISDGSGATPHRLSIQSNIIGESGNFQIDSSFGVSFEQLVAGHDALLQLGAGGDSAGILITSKTNTFTNALPGVDVTVAGESTDVVTVSVGNSDGGIVTTVQSFVDQYNKLRDKLSAYTAF